MSDDFHTRSFPRLPSSSVWDAQASQVPGVSHRLRRVMARAEQATRAQKRQQRQPGVQLQVAPRLSELAQGKAVQRVHSPVKASGSVRTAQLRNMHEESDSDEDGRDAVGSNAHRVRQALRSMRKQARTLPGEKQDKVGYRPKWETQRSRFDRTQKLQKKKQKKARRRSRSGQRTRLTQSAVQLPSRPGSHHSSRPMSRASVGTPEDFLIRMPPHADEDESFIWAEDAEDAAPDRSMLGEPMKSLSLQYEMAFRELYARHGSRPVPNPPRTKVVFELLDELITRLGPFGNYQPIAASLRDELYAIVYTRDLSQQLVPYFTLVRQAQEEVLDLVEREKGLQQRLREMQARMSGMLSQEQEIAALRRTVVELEERAEADQTHIQQLSAQLHDARDEAYEVKASRLTTRVQKQDVDKLSAQLIDTQQSQLALLRRRAHALQEQVQEVQKQYREAQATINVYEQERGGRRSE